MFLWSQSSSDLNLSSAWISPKLIMGGEIQMDPSHLPILRFMKIGGLREESSYPAYCDCRKIGVNVAGYGGHLGRGTLVL